ncbi:hypothetical protein V2J09_019090 [Rumex salicifolius]
MVKKFLASLPRKKYIHIVASLEQVLDLNKTSFEDIIGRLKAYEERVADEDEETQGEQDKLMYTPSENRYDQSTQDQNGFNGGKGRGGQSRGRGRGRGRSNGTKDLSKIQCFRCDKFGHYASNCPDRLLKLQETQANDQDDTQAADGLLMNEINSVTKSLVQGYHGESRDEVSATRLFSGQISKVAREARTYWKRCNEDNDEQGTGRRNSKAYRLFDPTSGKIVVSRNVEFNEDSSWGWNAYEEESQGDSGRFKLRLRDLHGSSLLAHKRCSQSDALDQPDAPRRSQRMSDLGILTYYLGIEVCQRERGIALKQEAYAKKILMEAGMGECNSSHIPMDPGLKISKAKQDRSINETEYRRNIGCLRYLLHTRPDLAYSVGVLSRYMQEPKESHGAALKRVLRYIQGTISYGLVFARSNKIVLVGYSDSSHNVDMDDGRSTTGHIFYLNDSPITWCSKKQETLALSLYRSGQTSNLAARAARIKFKEMRELIGTQDVSRVDFKLKGEIVGISLKSK